MSRRSSQPFKQFILGTFAVLLLAAVPAMAEAPPAAEAPAIQAPVHFAGMQLHLDPETGALRTPTSEEARLLSKVMHQRFGRHLRAATPTMNKNGSLQVVLGLEQFNFTVVTLDEAGQPVTHCTDDLDQAAELVEQVAIPGLNPREER